MVGVFELFKIGIGPSSSHTVGPMRAALAFVRGLERSGALAQTDRMQVELYGSLALTGIGHGTDTAVLAGLAGEAPDTIDPAVFAEIVRCATAGALSLAGSKQLLFARERDLLFHKDRMYPGEEATHPNG